VTITNNTKSPYADFSVVSETNGFTWPGTYVTSRFFKCHWSEKLNVFMSKEGKKMVVKMLSWSLVVLVETKRDILTFTFHPSDILWPFIQFSYVFLNILLRYGISISLFGILLACVFSLYFEFLLFHAVKEEYFHKTSM
jgi:hypothetical protein